MAGGMGIYAIYITTDGAGAAIFAPIRVDVKLSVAYDITARLLTLSVGREKPCDLRYDSTVKTLKVQKTETCEAFTFIRGRAQVPDDILEMVK